MLVNAVQPVDGLLAIDVGNSRIAMAVSDADGLHDPRRVSAFEEDDWNAPLRELWAGLAGARRRAVVISSVAPRTAELLVERIEGICEVEPVRVRDDLPLPMALDIDNADEVGVDRVCCAAAAFDRLRTACAVASFGTAITIDCVSAAGRFMGGAILPGLTLCCEALHEGTAQLPLVEAAAPSAALGRNTRDAILSGVVYGAIGALREIVERYATALGAWPQLVITGGNAELIRAEADFVDSVVPDLCLLGVALAYRKAAGQV
jgi:type III pantothenate kinase